jgi:hypothetical protein
MPRIKKFSLYQLILVTVCMLGALYVASWAHGYLFTTEPPLITLTARDGGHYGGDVQWRLVIESPFKLSHIKTHIDQAIHAQVICRNACYDDILIIPTKTLENGEHILEITATDGTFHQRSTTQRYRFIVDNLPLQASMIRPDEDACIFQGKTLHVQIQTNKIIKSGCLKIFSRSYPFIPEHESSYIYEAFIPVSSEETATEYPYQIELEDYVGTVATIDGKLVVVQANFRKQNLKVDSDRVKKDETDSLSHEQLIQDLDRATLNSPLKKLWQGVFYVPCQTRGISTEFGTIRTTKDRGRYAHNAIDFLAAPKSAVWASQKGIVAVVGRYAISGNTVVIDHGCGILTLYYHLDTIAPLKVGDMVQKGMPIGTIGMTGYANGYHLHWELRIYGVQVDPMQWTTYDF